MGYTKVTINSVDLIQFYHSSEDIFNETSEITAFKGIDVRKQDGQADFNRVHISTGEKAHMKRYIKKAVLEIYGIMYKILGGDSDDDPLFFDETITVSGNTFNAYGGYVVDNDGYREVTLKIMDSKISDAIVNFVLKEWYWLKNMPEDSKMHALRFDKLLIDINDLTLTIRKPL